MNDTINNGIPFVPENTIDPAAGLNESLLIIDRLLQLKVLGMKVNTPAVGPVAGDRYIVGTSPTGDWVGEELQVAEWMPDGYWGFSPASVAVYATSVYINTGTDWVPATAGSPTSWGGITGAIADQADLQSALDGKVDKVAGKQLSTEDYTTTEKTKLSGLTKQTSVSDDTAGRLMLVGGAGWLGTAPMPMPSSGAINTNLKAGMYGYRSSAGNTGGPENFGTVLVTSSHGDVAANGGWASQTFYGVSGQRYERYAINTAPTLPEHWSAWRVQWTSGNFQPGAWTNLTLINGWANSILFTRVRRVGPLCELQVNVSGGSAGTAACVLPVGFRPASDGTLNVVGSDIGNVVRLASYSQITSEIVILGATSFYGSAFFYAG